jgi:ABC-type multidrug transport system fused ATPase/permease subunit
MMMMIMMMMMMMTMIMMMMTMLMMIVMIMMMIDDDDDDDADEDDYDDDDDDDVDDDDDDNGDIDSQLPFSYLPPLITHIASGIKPKDVKGELVLRDVDFTYPARPNDKILDNFSLTIKAGETLALVGPRSGLASFSTFSLCFHLDALLSLWFNATVFLIVAPRGNMYHTTLSLLCFPS